MGAGVRGVVICSFSGLAFLSDLALALAVTSRAAVETNENSLFGGPVVLLPVRAVLPFVTPTVRGVVRGHVAIGAPAALGITSATATSSVASTSTASVDVGYVGVLRSGRGNLGQGSNRFIPSEVVDNCLDGGSGREGLLDTDADSKRRRKSREEVGFYLCIRDGFCGAGELLPDLEEFREVVSDWCTRGRTQRLELFQERHSSHRVVGSVHAFAQDPPDVARVEKVVYVVLYWIGARGKEELRCFCGSMVVVSDLVIIFSGGCSLRVVAWPVYVALDDSHRGRGFEAGDEIEEIVYEQHPGHHASPCGKVAGTQLLHGGT